MKGLTIALFAVLAVSVSTELTPDQHVTMKDLCADLKDLPVLGELTQTAKDTLSPHMRRVCEIYKKYYLTSSHTYDRVETRGLLDGLGGLVGENSKLGMLMKAADALNKAQNVFKEVKNLAPDVHQHLQSGIKDVGDTFHDLIDSITNEFMDKTTTKPAY